MSDQIAEKKSRKVPVIIVLGMLALCLAAFGTLWWLDSAPSGMAASTVVVVHKGESFRDIARNLKRLGLIKSALLLDGYSVLTHTASALQVGRYSIDKGSSTIAIHDMLVSGRQILVRVTIPEGWTLRQIAARLEAQKITTASAFLDAAGSAPLLKALHIPLRSAQGFLFPDTYLFPEGYPADKVVRTMAADFFKNLSEIYPEYASLPPSDLAAKVTMASVVEGEYRVPDEAPVIASVFYNRLAANIRLESCATVSYVLTDIEGKPHQTRLYDKDLWVSSPYNTYRHRGLPPGPISEPGRTALHAAFYPAKTNFLYFVLENPVSGKHFFSESYSAHELAKYEYVNLYLKQN